MSEMVNKIQKDSRPSSFESRFRLYVDESGDHVYKQTEINSHRYLCLLGCWFKNPDYLEFHNDLENFKRHYFHHHPDNPVILHREDMINCRGVFKILQEEKVRESVNNDLLSLIQSASFRVVAVLLDKAALRNSFGESASHPYHLGLGFLLQRYAGYLNHINRIGDVMAETRGKKEDGLLQLSYSRVYQHGVWGVTSAGFFQSALSSNSIKLQNKRANISGLQLSDILAHPTKIWALKRFGLINDNLAPFAQRLMGITESKFNRHLYNGKIDGYGVVHYP